MLCLNSVTVVHVWGRWDKINNDNKDVQSRVVRSPEEVTAVNNLHKSVDRPISYLRWPSNKMEIQSLSKWEWMTVPYNWWKCVNVISIHGTLMALIIEAAFFAADGHWQWGWWLTRISGCPFSWNKTLLPCQLSGRSHSSEHPPQDRGEFYRPIPCLPRPFYEMKMQSLSKWEWMTVPYNWWKCVSVLSILGTLMVLIFETTFLRPMSIDNEAGGSPHKWLSFQLKRNITALS